MSAVAVDAAKGPLEAKVEAVNLANRTAAWLQKAMQEVFSPLVGQVILKRDGSLLAKVKKLVDRVVDVPHDPRVHWYFMRSKYSVGWGVKACVSDSRHAHYHDVPAYVGHLASTGTGFGEQRVVLETLASPLEARADWTVGEVVANRLKYRMAEQAYRDAQSGLGPFGEYDV